MNRVWITEIGEEVGGFVTYCAIVGSIVLTKIVGVRGAVGRVCRGDLSANEGLRVPSLGRGGGCSRNGG